MRYHLTPANDIKAGVGRYSKSPTLQQGDRDIGRVDLAFERVAQYSLGLETRWNPSWTTEFTGFYKDGRQMIGNDTDRVYNNDGQFLSRGYEVSIKKNPTGKLFGWLSYTRSLTESRSTPADLFKRVSYDQTHVGSLVGGYRLTPMWSLGESYSYHTGELYTPSQGGAYSATTDTYSQSGTQIPQRNLPPWQTLSLYLSKDFLFDTWKMKLKTGIESFWFKPQTTGYTPSYDYSEDIPQRSLSTVPFLEIGGVL